MEYYFNIRYEFDKKAVHESIARQLQKNEANYICVADGVILTIPQTGILNISRSLMAACSPSATAVMSRFTSDGSMGSALSSIAAVRSSWTSSAAAGIA